MAISNLNIGDYIQKQNGDELSANEWNTVFSTIQNKMAEIITAVNFGGGSSGGSSSGGNGGPSTALYVNGELHTETPVILEPQQTYHLQGELYGQLVINATTFSGEAPATFKNTNLIFDGVTIITPTESGVYYAVPKDGQGDALKGYKGITITLAGDSVNTVMCTTVAAPADDQKGAIYSENNLRIQGSGYLNCINKGGHGVRASELKLYNPHIYCDGAHDGIHAKNISIYDGVYYFTNINDCFGTSSSSKASIYVCGGKIIANNMKVSSGNIFDYKNGVAYYVKRPEIITNIPSTQYATINGSCTLDGDLQWIYNTTYYNTADNSAAPIVRGYASKEAMEDNSGGVDIPLTNGVYTISGNNATYKCVRVSGKLSNPIKVEASFAYNGDNSLNIYLWKACIVTSSDNPCIFYTPTTRRVKVESYKETHNILLQNAQTDNGADYDCIKSESNINLELGGDSTLYISSKLGDGIDGSDVTCTDSTGVLYVEKCGQRGIKGTTIVIGPNADIIKGVPTYYVDTAEECTDAYHVMGTAATPATYFDGCVIIRNNCLVNTPSPIGSATGDASKLVGFADIYARKGKRTGVLTGDKPDRGSFFTISKYLTGVVICNSIGAMISADFNFSKNIFVSELITTNLYNLERLTYEQYLIYPKFSAPIIDKEKFKQAASA